MKKPQGPKTRYKTTNGTEYNATPKAPVVLTFTETAIQPR